MLILDEQMYEYVSWPDHGLSASIFQWEPAQADGKARVIRDREADKAWWSC